jgi:inorganic pyrophosphatase
MLEKYMSFPKPFYRWRPHPWHGLDVGPKAPELVHAYIEITPFDSMKYEIDKVTGYLVVDRPQRTSSRPPALYGFIPRTFCGSRISALSPKSTKGDGDPMDICIISEQLVVKLW